MDPRRAALARGRGLLDRACKLGDAFSCGSLADSFLKPSSGSAPTPDEVAQGVAVFKDACAARRRYACREVARLYSEGKLVAKDDVVALEYHEKSCAAAASGNGCMQVADMYLDGKDVPKDRDRALGLYEVMCTKGNGTACLKARVPDQRVHVELVVRQLAGEPPLPPRPELSHDAGELEPGGVRT